MHYIYWILTEILILTRKLDFNLIYLIIDKLQSSENLLLWNSNSEEQLCNAKMHRRSSENSGFILNLNNKISITNNANMQQSTIENEQQSSSIPNVSCDLNLANDEERLGQPTPWRINNSQETSMPLFKCL